jgi:hypothetical protein
MGFFTRNDWNVIAVIYERKDMYRVNGNRGKGSDATKARDGAKTHPRTIFYAVFDQKRGFLEGDFGRGQTLIPPPVSARLKREILTLMTVQTVLSLLEAGDQPMVAKPLTWGGYPKEGETE